MLPLKICLGTGKMGHHATAVPAIAAGRSRWALVVELTPLAHTEVSATGGLTPARGDGPIYFGAVILAVRVAMAGIWQ